MHQAPFDLNELKAELDEWLMCKQSATAGCSRHRTEQLLGRKPTERQADMVQSALWLHMSRTSMALWCCIT